MIIKLSVFRYFIHLYSNRQSENIFMILSLKIFTGKLLAADKIYISFSTCRLNQPGKVFTSRRQTFNHYRCKNKYQFSTNSQVNCFPVFKLHSVYIVWCRAGVNRLNNWKIVLITRGPCTIIHNYFSSWDRNRPEFWFGQYIRVSL